MRTFDTDIKTWLLDGDRGVPPVIGVILMVASTVILAAVIATFVMNMGPSDDQAPNTQLDITNETDFFNIAGRARSRRECATRVHPTQIRVEQRESIDVE